MFPATESCRKFFFFSLSHPNTFTFVIGWMLLTTGKKTKIDNKSREKKTSSNESLGKFCVFDGKCQWSIWVVSGVFQQIKMKKKQKKTEKFTTQPRKKRYSKKKKFVNGMINGLWPMILVIGNDDDDDDDD